MSSPQDTKPPALPSPPPAPLRAQDVELVPTAEDITPEDQAFIERVFDAVKDVDFLTPPPPPPKNLTGPDKKMQALRETVRRLERELARVGHIWRIKQKRVQEVDSIINQESGSRANAETRYQQLKDSAQKAATAAKVESDRLSAQIAQLTRERAERDREIADLKERLAREEKEKAAVITDAKAKLEQARDAFNELRNKSTAALADSDARLKKLEGDLEAAKGSAASMGKRLAERESTIKVLTDEMSQARLEQTERVEAIKKEVAAKSDEAARLAKDLEQARARAAKLEAELEVAKAAPAAPTPS